MLIIAVPKGRSLSQCLGCLRLASIVTNYDSQSRSLAFRDSVDQIRIVTLKMPDISFSVTYRSADIGFVGSDTLSECSQRVFATYYLCSANCHLAVASLPDVSNGATLGIATKYPRTTKNFIGLGALVNLVKLNGALEVSPVIKLADAITDIVSTGSTMRANGLVTLKRMSPLLLCLVLNHKVKKCKRPMLVPLIALLKYSFCFLSG